MRTLTLIALLAGLAAGGAAAQETEVHPHTVRVAQSLAGVYRFEPQTGAQAGCRLTLDPRPDFAVMRASAEAVCETEFFFMGELSGWMPIGTTGISMSGAELTTLANFTPDKDGVLSALIENDGKKYTLHRVLGSP